WRQARSQSENRCTPGQATEGDRLSAQEALSYGPRCGLRCVITVGTAGVTDMAVSVWMATSVSLSYPSAKPSPRSCQGQRSGRPPHPLVVSPRTIPPPGHGRDDGMVLERSQWRSGMLGSRVPRLAGLQGLAGISTGMMRLPLGRCWGCVANFQIPPDLVV